MSRVHLAICAIAKNEAANIVEWIAFHHALGVEKFFVYDNGSSDNTADRVQPLVRAGIVEFIDWPIKPGQVEAYDDFARRHRDDVAWAAFIDLDEFINPFGFASIGDWLAPLERHAAIALQWVTFGPSGHETPPGGLLIEAYRQRLPELAQINGHIKTIVRLTDYVRSTGPHTFDVNGSTVNEYGDPLENGGEHGKAIQPVLPHRGIMLNHYYTRSRQEWMGKVMRGEADSPPGQPLRRRVEWFHHYEVHAVEDDDRILHFAEATRSMLAKFATLPSELPLCRV